MPNSDPVYFGPTTRVSWSQVTDKPAWFGNVSGGGTAPLNIDMQNGGAFAVGPPSMDSSVVSKEYINNTLLAPYAKTTALTAAIDAAKVEVKAYADAIDIASEWDEVTNKPAWFEQVQSYSTPDSTGIRIISNLDMNQGRIEHLGIPMTDDEGTNKKYVDDLVDATVVDVDEKIATTLDEAKKYTDGQIAAIEDPYWADIQNKPQWTSYIDYDATGDNLFVIKPLDLSEKKLTHVGAPTEQTDATTKKYVDDALDLKLNTTTASATYITTLGATALANAAVTESKTYTDTKFAAVQQKVTTWDEIPDKPQWEPKLEYVAATATESESVKVITNLDMNNHVITNVGYGTELDHAVNVSQLNTAVKEGGIADLFAKDTINNEIDALKALNMNSKMIKNLPLTASDDGDVVSRKYLVDYVAANAGSGSSAFDTYFTYDNIESRLDTNTSIHMNSRTITGLSTPVEDSAASTKRYVDGREFVKNELARRLTTEDVFVKQTVNYASKTVAVDFKIKLGADTLTTSLPLSDVAIYSAKVTTHLYHFNPAASVNTVVKTTGLVQNLDADLYGSWIYDFTSDNVPSDHKKVIVYLITFTGSYTDVALGAIPFTINREITVGFYDMTHMNGTEFLV